MHWQSFEPRLELLPKCSAHRGSDCCFENKIGSEDTGGNWEKYPKVDLTSGEA